VGGRLREGLLQAREVRDYAVNAGDRENAEHGIAGKDQQHVTACGRGPLVRSQQGMKSGGVAELGLAQVGH
jgi:hypothetical protein